MSYEQTPTHTCCDDPYYKEKSRANEGEKMYAYSECQNCGAKWRDVFVYTHSEMKK